MQGEWDTEGTQDWKQPAQATSSNEKVRGVPAWHPPTYEGSYGLRGALAMRKFAQRDKNYGFTLRSLEKKFTPARITDPLSIRANIYDELGMEDPSSAIGMAQDFYMRMYG